MQKETWMCLLMMVFALFLVGQGLLMVDEGVGMEPDDFREHRVIDSVDENGTVYHEESYDNDGLGENGEPWNRPLANVGGDLLVAGIFMFGIFGIAVVLIEVEWD